MPQFASAQNAYSWSNGIILLNPNLQNEDVITDKSELSLMEATRVDVVLDNLDAAMGWLGMTEEDLPWKAELESRLTLRKVLFLFDCGSSAQKSES